MNEIQLSELRHCVTAVLRTKGYKESCIKRYNHTWDHVQKFMDTKGIVLYSGTVGDSFLFSFNNSKPYKELSHRQKEKVRHVDVLSGFQINNTIPQPRYKFRPIVFEGELGKPFNTFIEEEHVFKKGGSIKRYTERIEHLYRFLQKESVSVKELDTPCMLRFINHLNNEKSTVNCNNIMMTVRLFIRFLCSHELLSNNNSVQWMSLLRLRQVHQPKIPSVYSNEEIESLIAAIDRGSPHGKRDYAMILLAARYGIRISDIIGMRHHNLDWEHNQIILFQQKTGKKNIIPLSEEVGSAIIDYLKHGRPNIKLPYIFITANAPYKELTTSGMGIAIKKYFLIAGVNFTNKKHGPHSLRHSLATNLLKSNEPLPVISEILGHSSTQSTMEYLRVDENLLRQCALEVPFVPSSFYGNLYGS